MKIFGHPLHLMLIHFPSALFPMECIFYGIFYFTGDFSFAHTAFYTLMGGVVFGWIAAIFGVWDLLRISSEKTDVLKKALVHGSINTSVLIVYSILAYSLFKNYPELPGPKLIVLNFKIALVAFMVLGNYIGASLVLKHKVGVEE